MKKKENLRNRILYSNVTAKEYYAIIHAAGRLDISISEFVRRAALYLVQKEFDKN